MTETAGRIYAAIPQIIADVGPVGKNATNQQQGYKYRSADDICDALHGALGKHCVFTTCEIKERTCTERQTKSGGTLFYVVLNCQFRFHAQDGSSVCTDAVGEAMDSGDKATNKAMTAAYKYALLQVFCLMGHEDSEVHSPEVAAAKQTRERVKSRRSAELDAVAKKHDLNGSQPIDNRQESPSNAVSKLAAAVASINSFTGSRTQWDEFKGRLRTRIALQLDLTEDDRKGLDDLMANRDGEFLAAEIVTLSENFLADYGTSLADATTLAEVKNVQEFHIASCKNEADKRKINAMAEFRCVDIRQKRGPRSNQPEPVGVAKEQPF